MSEFSPTEKELLNDHQTFLSDDEGNVTQYFVQRFMEQGVSIGDQSLSPEQYENLLNSTKELNSRFLSTKKSSKYVEEEIIQTRTAPLRNKSRLETLNYVDRSVELSMQNYKPTDYTYARSCTYRRSSPSDKNLTNPVLRRQSLHKIGLNRAETFFYQADNADDELHHVYKDFSTFKSSKTWFSTIFEWFARKKAETNRLFTNLNGVPPQFKSQTNQRTIKRKQISAYIDEIFMYFWLICTRTVTIFESMILRAKDAFNSGKTTSNHEKTLHLNEMSLETEIASKEIKEIHKIITEETIVDEFAKEETRPKRSAFLWPCLFCFILPLLCLLPICFLASNSENNSTFYNYSKHLWESIYLRNVDYIPPITSLPVENRLIIDEESLKKFEFRLIELQNRVAALEGANAGASIDLEKFRLKLTELAGDSSLLTDLSGKLKIHLNDMDDFRTKLKTLETAVDVGTNEQRVWQKKLADLIQLHDKRNDELNILRDKIESLAKADCNCSSIIIGETNSVGVGLDDVNTLIAAAIAKYDADKTGLADYALEPAGGAVMSIRCSKTYYPYTRKITWWNFPFGYQDYSPRTVIQPGLAPGECWAFTGSPGYLVVKLSWTIQVTAVSYEHIPRSISPDGRIDSAPKRMEIYGLQSEYDDKPVKLGEFVYDDNGTPLQYFPVQTVNASPVPIVELRIMSNHGHPVYTCLYRFRVHGRIIKEA